MQSNAVSAASLAFNWAISKAKLDRAKREEGRWRKLIVTTLFSDAALGTNRHSVSANADLKYVKTQIITLKYTAHDPDSEATLAKLGQDIMRFNNTDPEIANIFQFKLVFNNSAYKLLTPEAKALVDASGLIEIKDASPLIELSDPKKEIEIWQT